MGEESLTVMDHAVVFKHDVVRMKVIVVVVVVVVVVARGGGHEGLDQFRQRRQHSAART